MPPAQESPTIDEAEEEAAAAAEAANIGGTVVRLRRARRRDAPPTRTRRSPSPARARTRATSRPIDELIDAAEGNEDDGLSPEEAQINEAIDDTANPLAGEQADSGRPGGDPEWRTWSGRTEQ